jgi:fatty-acyl-CoA synthase
MIHGPPAPAVKHSTLHEVLAAAARTQHGLIFVGMHEDELTLSYRDLYRGARRTARALVGLGVRPGDRVAVGAPTSPRFMEGFFGTLLAGAVPAPLCPARGTGRKVEYDARIARMLVQSGARLLLADAPTSAAFRAAVDVARPELGCRTVEELLSEAGRDEAEVAVCAESLGLIQFSSGSTSAPKGVALSHRSLLVQSAMFAAVFDAGGAAADKMVTWLPLYHDMGLIGCVLTPLYMQIPVVLMSPEVFIARPLQWLRAISRHGATLTGAPNFAYELCLRRISDADLADLRLHTLRHAFSGAEPVSAALMETFSRRFARCGLRQHGVLRPGYGLAEAALAVTYSTRGGGPIRRIGADLTMLAREGRVVEGTCEFASVGTPVPGVALQIRDDEGRELPERQVGRIFVKSPSLMQGYFGDSQATAEVLFGEWLDTGDLGFVDGDELFITGREKELVIIRGAKYPPQQFEDCLVGVEAVRRGWAVAAGFRPDSSGSEELLVLAERNDSPATDDCSVVKQIRTKILEVTGVRAHTVLILPTNTLRRTTSGKIRRRDALQRFLAGEFTRAGANE